LDAVCCGTPFGNHLGVARRETAGPGFFSALGIVTILSDTKVSPDAWTVYSKYIPQFTGIWESVVPAEFCAKRMRLLPLIFGFFVFSEKKSANVFGSIKFFFSSLQPY
jgi:hypothetical protein